MTVSYVSVYQQTNGYTFYFQSPGSVTRSTCINTPVCIVVASQTVTIDYSTFSGSSVAAFDSGAILYFKRSIAGGFYPNFPSAYISQGYNVFDSIATTPQSSV